MCVRCHRSSLCGEDGSGMRGLYRIPDRETDSDVLFSHTHSINSVFCRICNSNRIAVPVVGCAQPPLQDNSNRRLAIVPGWCANPLTCTVHVQEHWVHVLVTLIERSKYPGPYLILSCSVKTVRPYERPESGSRHGWHFPWFKFTATVMGPEREVP